MEMDRNAMIVITGAAGMIGSGIVRYLNDHGFYHLLLVDDLGETEKWKNLVGKRFSDFVSRHQLFEYLPRFEAEIAAVIHMGACSDTEEKNGDYLLENNYRFSIRLAQWTLSCNKRFIYASSAATYGNGLLGFSDAEELLEQWRPLNMYGYSKHLFDLWMKRTGGLKKTVGLKYFNVFGPNEYHKGRMASMVLKMMNKVKNEGVIHLFKSTDPSYQDGEQRRDFIYLKDVAQMTCRFLENSVSGIYNIGRGKAVTWKHLAHALFAALDKPVNIQYIDMPASLAGQYQNYTCADMRKYLSIFPDISFTGIDAAVREYVLDYLLESSRW
jgi:ADP-L-glycero-D-manno-heptose 6-epimerase